MKVDIKLADAAVYAEQSKDSFERDLQNLVNIPSVSMDPAHKADIRKTAQEAARLLMEAGGKAEIVETNGNPVVVGNFASSPNHPTVTVYNHLDVQPADPSEWKTHPFEMKIAGGTYFGRGTTDDKGPALSVLYAAKYARQQNVPINIRFIWELEEEIGSPNFERFVQDNKSKLSTDSVVVSDTVWVSRQKPAIGYGLRGLHGMTIKLTTGSKDVHSGCVGGLARNPIGELAQLLSECYDARSGEVKIPGFYSDVRPLSQQEKQNFVSSGFSLPHFQSAYELKSLRTSDTAEATRRIWAYPTMEVHGIIGGYSGPGIKTIVPYQAEAKVSFRLVPDQDPNKIAKLVADFMKSKNPDVVIEREGCMPPYLGQFSGPFAEAAAQAMTEAFGVQPAFVREGGSIGAVVSMRDALDAPIIFLGLSLPEHGYHAINENFDWQQAGGGIKMFVKYFTLLSAIKQQHA